MTDITAKAIADSIGPTPDHTRLLTILGRAPKFIHQETLRHRLIYIEDQLRGDWDFSFSVSSARAIPFQKLLEEAKDPSRQARPVIWGTEQKGMSPGEEISDNEPSDPAWRGLGGKTVANLLWDRAGEIISSYANALAKLGIHKSICNRLIEPFIHVNFLMTATTPGWMNFFGLRLDKAADPTLRAFTEECWKVWNESQPTTLQPGEWHLPFIEVEDIDFMFGHPSGHLTPEELVIWARKVSVARCARLSYLSFETNKRSTIEEDLKLYDRLVGSTPIHASPAEHQATPDEVLHWGESKSWNGEEWYDIETTITFENEEQSGNLGPGWRQYRKMLPGENLAPLPSEYQK